jgi:hypothetical protein
MRVGRRSEGGARGRGNKMKAIDDVRTKLSRAEKLNEELITEIGRFIGGDPYKVDTRRDQDSKRLIYYIAHATAVPAEVALVAGDLLHNLRSALDHLAWHLVIANGQKPARQTYFPIADDNLKFARDLAKVAFSTDAIAEVAAIQPYRCGNDALWRLHRLNNIDKHRMLIAVGSALRSVDIGKAFSRSVSKLLSEKRGRQVPAFSLFLQPKDRSFPLVESTELFLDEPNAEPIEDMRFRFEVALQEPDADLLNGEPLLRTMLTLTEAVQSVVGRLEKFL